MRRLAILIVAATLAVSSAAYGKGRGSDDGFDDSGRHHSDSSRVEFYGTVNKIPKDRVGIWVIDHQRVRVDRDTFVDEEHGIIRKGTRVEVKATRGEHGGLRAHKIEFKR